MHGNNTQRKRGREGEAAWRKERTGKYGGEKIKMGDKEEGRVPQKKNKSQKLFMLSAVKVKWF